MATSMRGSAGSGKEKKGISPSSSTIKRTPKPLSATSSTRDEKSLSPTNSSKPVPNYLRPTISSSFDTNKQPKKPGTDTASASKSTYTRRSSFDRPPPPSQVQRSIRGGLTGGAAGARDIRHQRSSSFSNKSATSSSTRPSSDKQYARTSSLNLKDGKVEPSLCKSRSIKKSNLSTSTRKESVSINRKKAPRSVTSEPTGDCESRPSVDHMTLEVEDDLVNLDEHEVQSLLEMSEMPDSNEELADPDTVKEEEDPKGSTREEEEEKSMVVDRVLETVQVDSQHVVEESTDAEAEAAGEQVDSAAGNQKDKAEEKTLEVDPTDFTMEEVTQEDETEPMETEAGKVEVNPTDTTKEDEKEPVETEAEKVEVEPTDTTKEDEKEQVEREAEKVEVEPTAAKNESRTVDSLVADNAPRTARPAQPSSAGKKDSKQDYNDVIEETASKLMGGGRRTNKVLALAGAFETVISLQDTNKS